MMKHTTLRFYYLFVVALLSLTGTAQEVPPVTIHVEEAGTLPELIASSKMNQITNLTLTGQLNSTDIKFIREMAGKGANGEETLGVLAVLNMSNANIKEGGRPYYYDGKNGIITSNNTIGSNMFRGCHITSLILPNNILFIEDNAFYESLLTSLTIPDNVISMRNNVFYNCKELTSIAIPGNVTSIGHHIFSSCENITSITLNKGLKRIGDYAFSGCSKLPSITIPESVSSIGEHAFYLCNNLASVTIGNGSIGDYAFEKCPKLTTAIIDSGIIGYRAFASTSLTSVTFGNGVKSIKQSAFELCENLTSITIPDGVTDIERDAFAACTGVTSVTIGDGLANLGEKVFYNCYKLESYTVSPNNKNFTTTDGILFNKDKTSLIKYPISKAENTFIIPTGITTIGTDAFSECKKLVSITIPESVNSIARRAFYATTIKEIFCMPTTPPKCGTTNDILMYTNIEKLYIPQGSYAAYWNTDTWGSIKNIIELDENGKPIDKEYYIKTTYDKSQGTVLINNNETQPMKLPENSPVTFSITPSFSYAIDKVILNQQDITEELTDDSYTIEKLTENITLEVTFKEKFLFVQALYDEKLGNVFINDEESKCKNIREGEKVTFKIVPQKGYSIENVLIEGEDITSKLYNNMLTVENLSSNITLTVNFKPTTYLISIECDDAQGRAFINGEETKSADFIKGERATLTIVPNDGFAIQKAMLGDTDISSLLTFGTYTIMIPQIESNLNLEVLFMPLIPEKVSITTSFNDYEGTVLINGKKEISREIEMGKEVTFTVIPNDGYEIQQIKAGGTVDITSAFSDGVCIIPQIMESMSITVTFRPIEVETASFTVNCSEGGNLSHEIPIGSFVTYLITPAEKWRINTVSFNEVDVTYALVNNRYTTPAITKNSTLSVVFVESSTGVSSLDDDAIKVYASQGTITVKEAPTHTLIQIYSISGQIVYNNKSVDDTTVITLAESGIYLVKIKNNTYKVSL